MMSGRFINKNEAISLLRDGYVVALPTETVYGIFISKTYGQTNKLDEAKNRISGKQYALYSNNINDKYDDYTKIQLPGPFTIVQNGIGYRYSPKSIIREIIDEIGELIGTSANISGQYPVTKWQHISLNVPIFQGNCDIGLESTVVDIDKQEILRQGAGIFHKYKENSVFQYPKREIIYNSKIIPTKIEDFWAIMNDFQVIPEINLDVNDWKYHLCSLYLEAIRKS